MSKGPSKAPSTILGGKTFAAITAVEGLQLSAAARQRVARLTRSRLTPDQRREEVLKAYLRIKGRK